MLCEEKNPTSLACCCFNLVDFLFLISKFTLKHFSLDVLFFMLFFFIDMLWRLYRVSINLDIASIVSPVIPITEMFFILPLSCCLKP